MPDFSGMKALVVDDEPDLREITVLELENYGCQVEEAANGKIAIEMMKNFDYDFIISDVRMPEGNGIDLLDELVILEKAKPFLFLVTGFADLTREEAMKRGASEMFFKPVEWNKMLEDIAKCVIEGKGSKAS